ncbi:MAG: nucleotidyltransferase family protein [Bacteroidota bacterium]|nr:nucleotidyltransferase family protein [Bacteroidota bacterium]
MKNIQDHIIHEKAPIKKALEQLNKLPNTLTLFVVNEKQQLIGTLTDGDIRRGFLSGRTLEDNTGRFVTSNFHYMNNGIDVQKVKKLKNKGIRLLPVIDDNRQIIKVYDLHRLNSVLPLDAVIMAGGRGKRLRPITDTIPKPMIELGGKPIIEHNIDRLISYGIENVYISVNYLKEQIIAYFGDGTKKGINIQYIEEEQPLGTAGALSLVKEFENDILLTNSDLFTNIDYEDLYLNFLKKNADMAIASIPYTVNIPYAIFEEKHTNIKGFKEKPSNTHYANAGIYIIKQKLLKYIPENQFYNTTDLMEACIAKKETLIHNPVIGYWIDIGKHEDLKRAQEIVKHV